jgi:chromate transporter
MNKFKTILKLFLTMLKVGAFTFGGGYAMIAIFEHEFVEKHNWIDKDEFYNVVAIAESTPGPIAINSATYIGYRVSGVLGSIFATIGMVLPSLIIIFTISLFFDAFLALKPVAYAFKGIQVCVCYLILSAGIKMFKKMPKKVLPLTLTLVTLVTFVTLSLFAIKFSSIFYILIGAGVSIIVNSIILASKKANKGGND